MEAIPAKRLLSPTSSDTSSDVAKLPKPNLETIRSVTPAVWETNNALWRLHNPRGEYPRAWNELRRFGPLRDARFDPWAGEARDRLEGVGYFGFDIATCLAEVFQDRRRVDALNSDLHVTSIEPTRPLLLLDLRADYPIKIGASHSLNGGSKNLCREWAQALREVHPEVDGFAYIGVAGRNCAVLFDSALSSFPPAPRTTRAISDKGLASWLADAAQQIGYRFIG